MTNWGIVLALARIAARQIVSKKGPLEVGNVVVSTLVEIHTFRFGGLAPVDGEGTYPIDIAIMLWNGIIARNGAEWHPNSRQYVPDIVDSFAEDDSRRISNILALWPRKTGGATRSILR
jgi:hypothetical protein